MHSASDTATALLLVDIQQGFDHPTHWGSSWSTPTFKDNVVKLLASARRHNESHSANPVTLFHVQHHSLSPGSMLHPSARLPDASEPAIAPMPYAAPLDDNDNELVIIKHHNSCFVRTDLECMIREKGIKQLIIVGLTTDHCVSTTTRMAANLQVLGDNGGPDGTGFGHHGILLVRDATATYDKGGFDAETVQKVNLASLDGEFAKVVATEAILKEVFTET